MDIVESFAGVPTFDIIEPEALPVPFVFSAPHSGTFYPRDLVARTRLDPHTLRRSEDTFVDELFAPVALLGAPLIRARFPRVYLDLNRDETELDPAMFDGPLGVDVVPDSPRVGGGLGVIAKIVGERQEIYDGPLPAAEAGRRIEQFWRPYHAALADRLDAAADAFGAAVLIDCHSMPSGAVKCEERAGQRPDIVLGDRFGTSCSPQLADEMSRTLRRRGFVVGRNRPYAGGYITERYGRPPRVHAVQLEINRALYMDEAAYTRSPAFAEIKGHLVGACAEVISWFVDAQLLAPWQLAAE